MIGSLPHRCHRSDEAGGSPPSPAWWWKLDRQWALLSAGDAQRGWCGVAAGGSVGVLRVYQVEQRPQRPLWRPFMGPHHEFRGEHVDPTMLRCGNPGRGDSVEAPDGD
jgi:hypothetical protein